MNWQPHASRLASQVAHPVSRWRPPVATVPRHVLVPRWWALTDPGSGSGTGTWELRDGPGDPGAWLEAAYADRSLVTRIGPMHADHAAPGDQPAGMPTSSATLPGLAVQMLRHAMIAEGMDVLDVGTGSGYGCALLTGRLGPGHVTSVDVDPYLTRAAGERLDSIGLHPGLVTCDATGPLPGSYDRIISTVAIRPVPASWLAALRPGGRLVTTIAGTCLIVTADKTPDGGAAGVTQWDRAGFMTARTGPGYPPGLTVRFTEIRDAEAEHVTTGRYPVVNVTEAWDLYSAIGVTIPEQVLHHYEETPARRRTAWMLHPDGSWARATGAAGRPPVVHQSGPLRLWDILDDLREAWLRDGFLPGYGASVIISPDGAIHLSRGRWAAAIPAS